MTPGEQRVEVVPGGFDAGIIGIGARAVRVVVSGELDLAAAPQLDDALTQALAVADDIVVDLSPCGSSTRPGSTRSSEPYVRPRPGGQPQDPFDPPPQVARLFEIVGMAHTLPLVDI